MKLSQKHILFAAVVLLLVVFSFPVDAQINKGKKSLGLCTVCIDPGHGGKDVGCVSKDKKTYEKDIVLSISTLLSDKIKNEFPDVKVVMTRSDDRFIPLEQRAAIATRNNADLFISIHINASDKYTSASGFSIHTLGQSSVKNRDLYKSNMELCKRENSAILLEDDYTAKYQGFDPNNTESYIIFNLMQNSNLEQSLVFAEDVDKAMEGGPIKNNRGVSQDPFLVLWKTTMPAVLIECAFMTNLTDLATLRTAEGLDKIAENIFTAFRTFKKRYDSSLSLKDDTGTKSNGQVSKPATATSGKDLSKPVESKDDSKITKQSQTEKVTDKVADNTAKNPVTGVRYGTQVLASAKVMTADDSFFKGYKFTTVKSGKLYKYIIGVSSDIDQARKSNRTIRNSFPDSFLVKIDESGFVTRTK